MVIALQCNVPHLAAHLAHRTTSTGGATHVVDVVGVATLVLATRWKVTASLAVALPLWRIVGVVATVVLGDEVHRNFFILDPIAQLKAQIKGQQMCIHTIERPDI